MACITLILPFKFHGRSRPAEELTPASGYIIDEQTLSIDRALCEFEFATHTHFHESNGTQNVMMSAQVVHFWANISSRRVQTLVGVLVA